MLMIYTREDKSNPRLFTADPDMLTLEQAIKILNPDALRQPMALKRGAYKKLITEFRKGKIK